MTMQPSRPTGGLMTSGDTQSTAEVRPVRIQPAVDVFENEEELLIVAEVPGARRDTLDVRLAEDVLTLDCRRELRSSQGAVTADQEPVHYHRRFALPAVVSVEGITARLEAGILSVRLPKAERHKPRQIRVEQG